MTRRILISGGGIAGLTLAFWLERHGFEPVVVEVAPRVRGGGYMIDFWGRGYDVAERMDILPALRAAHYDIPRLEFVDSDSRVTGTFPVRKLRKLLGGRHLSLLRSDLERVLYERIRGRVDVRFGRAIAAVHAREDRVDVELTDGATEAFDLVVGADGLRSNTRRLQFGPDERFERFLGYYTASFTIFDYLDRRDAFLSYTQPGKQVGIYSIADGRLATFFIWSDEPLGHLSEDARKARLRQVFGTMGWETPRLLAAMNATADFYFDAVSQVELPHWSSGRVALCGDACQCVSLIAGQGSALAMAGAYILARELSGSPAEPAAALARYEAALKPEIVRKQAMARRFAASFVPASRLGIVTRNLFTKLMFIPPVARHFIRRFLADEIALDDAARAASR